MDFYAQTAVVISRQIVYNNLTPNISADTVTLILQRDPASASIAFTGDVISGGSSGIVVFDLTEADTDLEPGVYQYELVWDSVAYGEKVADSGLATVKPRLDAPTP